MDWVTYKGAIRGLQPKRWSDRQCTLDALERALDGKLYDHIKESFSKEFVNESSDERLSLDKRRSAVSYQLPLLIARGFVNLLFGKGHRPKPFVRNDDASNAWIQAFIDDTNLWWHLYHAAFRGQSGSSVIVLRVLAKDTQSSNNEHAAGTKRSPGAYHIEVWPAAQCQPVFLRWSPDDLGSLQRTYIVKKDVLAAEGYDVAALEKKWSDVRKGAKAIRERVAVNQQAFKKPSDEWVMRCELSDTSEKWFEPIPKWLYETTDFDEKKEWATDANRSFDHNLDEVPALWIRNLPGSDDIFPDGMSSFEPSINFQFRIDRTLSQTGRALDYAGDPQLAIQEGNDATGGGIDDADETPSGTASDVVSVQAGGDAKFLEIKGEGIKVAIETYVDKLDELARRLCAASSISNDTKTGVMSGVAMRMLNDAQIGVLGIMQIAYGDKGLTRLLRLGMRIHAKVNVSLPSFQAKLAEIMDTKARQDARSQAVASGADPLAQITAKPAKPVVPDANAGPNADAHIECPWPEPYPLSGAEKLAEVSAAVSARDGKAIAEETLVASLSSIFSVENPDQERDTIIQESYAAEQRELALVGENAKIQATYAVKPI